MPRPVRPRPAARRALLWIAGISASLPCVYGALRGDGGLAVVSGCALVLLACAPVAARLRRDPLDPPGIYIALSGACYGVMSLAWLGDPPAIPAPGVDQSHVAEALVLVAGGLLAFSIAARLGAGRVRPRPRLTGGEHEPIPLLLLLGLFAIGAAGLGIGLLIGAVGFNNDAGAAAGVLAYGQLFAQLSLLGALAIGAFALWVFRGHDRYRWLLFGLMACQAVGGFATGYKQQALLPVLLVGVAYVSCRGRIPWRAVAVAGALGILVLLPATMLYRSILRPDAPGASSSVRTPAGLVGETSDYLNVRFRLVDSVALIQTRTPAVYPYGNGRRYTLLPALVVLPRAVWSDKPILNDGVEFSRTYWEVPPTITTATPLTQAGDLYRNFAWQGVLLGMAAWGLLVGLFARLNGARRSPRMELLWLVALVQVVPFVDSDLPQLIAGTSRTLLLAAIVAWLALPGASGPTGFARLVQAGARVPRGWLPRRVIGVPESQGH